MDFAITTVRGYRHHLSADVEAIGGVVFDAGYADGSTSWVVLASFPKGASADAIQEALWQNERYAHASVSVTPLVVGSRVKRLGVLVRNRHERRTALQVAASFNQFEGKPAIWTAGLHEGRTLGWGPNWKELVWTGPAQVQAVNAALRQAGLNTTDVDQD